MCEHPLKLEGWELHLQQLSWQESLLQFERSFCPSAHRSSPSTLTFLPLREWLPEQPGVVLLIPEPGVHQDFSQRRTGDPAALAWWIAKRRGTLFSRENRQGLKRKKSPEELWCQCLPDTSCPAHAAGAGLGAALEDRTPASRSSSHEPEEPPGSCSVRRNGGGAVTRCLWRKAAGIRSVP